MKNPAPSTKTIRVSYCDPDATDSSSDEGSEKSQKKSKRKVHEIEVEFVEKNQDPRYDSGDFQEETGFKKQTMASEGEKIVGVRTMISGKFWAEIKDPIKRRCVFLGVFGTSEAASRACLAQESKFAAAELRAQWRVESAASQISPLQDLVVLDSLHPRTSAVKKIKGVCRSKSGKFGASIRDPFKKKKVWLGSFTTVEEASRAYFAKKAQLEAKELGIPKLQFEAKMLGDKQRIDGVVSGKSTLQASVSSVLSNGTSDLASFQGRARTRISDVRRTKSGKFSATITDPITKRSLWLGTFATEEEASGAYLAMEAEFGAEKLKANWRIDRIASGKSIFQDSMSSVLGNDTPDCISFQGGARTRIPGVRRRNSGKFCAEIRNPMTKRRVWIGTFATEEEASRAYLAKKAEFSAMKLRANLTSFQGGASTRIPGVQKRDSDKFSEEIRIPITERCAWIDTFATEQMASRAYLSKKAEFEEELGAKQRFERVASENSLAQCSVSSVIETETSDLLNETGVAESVGDNKVSGDQVAGFGLFNGVQVVDKNGFLVGENNVSGNQGAGFGFFNGVQVVDKNGFLVGEFSLLDDLSICSEEDAANS